MAKGNKSWPNTWTEVEDLGDGKFAASIGVGHRVFFDKADDNKPKKHKLTDERPAKDYVLIQSAKCCVEVYPYYAKYYDVQHEEVRLEEERWLVQRLFKEPDDWRDVDAYNPVIAIEEYSEPAGNVVKVTVTYDTDYGVLTVEYFQRDGNALKHNVSFQNTSGGEETFRVLQRWAGIVGAKCNGKDIPVAEDTSYFAFHRVDKPQGEFTIAENLWSMMFNPDGSEKTDQCLQRPISIEAHAHGMKADFIYGNWVLAQDESLEIDPDLATLDDPNEDGWIKYEEDGAIYTRNKTSHILEFGGVGSKGSWEYDWRSYVEWDISSLSGATLTANPVFKYHGDIVSATDEEINPLTEEAPSSAADADLYGYIATGAAYVDPFDCEVGAGKQVDLGASAKTDLQNAIDAAQSWFAIGLQSPADEGTIVSTIATSIFSEDKTDAADPKPTLYVEYMLVKQPAEKDTWLNNNSATTNYGTDAYLMVGAFSPYIYRSILEFDISALPGGASIETSTLLLYYYDMYLDKDPVGETVWAYKLSRTDWVEDEATWNEYKSGSNWGTGGGDYVTSNPDGGSTTVPADFGWMSWDVKAITEDAIDNVGNLVELLLLGSSWDSGESPYFHSSDYTDNTDLCPKLVIEYTVGWTGKFCGVTNPSKIMGVEVANISKVMGVA